MDGIWHKSSDGKAHLVHPDLDSYQGPALISAYDAVLSDQDWEGIQNPQMSSDPFKMGCCSTGFTSAYHLTGTTTHSLLTVQHPVQVSLQSPVLREPWLMANILCFY